MFFPESYIEELKQRLPLSKIVSGKVKLLRNGNIYKGLCPFHNEKTPSFSVNDYKGSYYCFGCHAHGDVINFISNIDKLSFTETVAYLAKLAGMQMPQLDIAEQKKEEQKYGLIELNSKATEFFKRQLKLSSNINAQDYLKQRSIDDKDIALFSLGYAPRDGLIAFLEKNGFTKALIEESGLIIKTDSGRYIERFRDRIIFPIKNFKGQIVGFGGRSLSAEIMPKYLNSPETILFKKNHLLYAADIASKHAIKTERIIVVEGYMDTIFMHKANLPETVATLGTAFGPSHLHSLWKIANEPILCFDGDDAGKKAMIKAAYIALPLLEPGLTLKFCFLPKNQDPDEVIQQYGSAYIHKLLENNVSLADLIWETELTHLQSKEPESKALFEQKIYDLINQIKNTIVQNHYRQFFKNKLWHNIIKLSYNKTKTLYSKSNVKNNSISLSNSLSIEERLLNSMFAQLILYPDLIKDRVIFDHLLNLDAKDQQGLDILRSIMIEFHEDEKKILNDLILDNNLGKLSEFLCGPRSSFIDNVSIFDDETAKLIWIITYKKYLLELLKTEYSQFMNQAYHASEAFEKAEELRKSINILIEEITEKENNLV
jgi:DNA primase